tara:strand:+ start:51 stop:455 length:405 start_codon:yes stop_codon:yes gene_type:complete
MFITRRERFSSAHKLENQTLSNTENQDVFGKCFSVHGHNYELFVTVTGSINRNSGFVMDLKDLKALINTKVISKLDHKYINEVSFMKGRITSTENLCIAIWEELKKPIKNLGGKLYKIKITETENNYFEYYGKS